MLRARSHTRTKWMAAGQSLCTQDFPKVLHTYPAKIRGFYSQRRAHPYVSCFQALRRGRTVHQLSLVSVSCLGLYSPRKPRDSFRACIRPFFRLAVSKLLMCLTPGAVALSEAFSFDPHYLWNSAWMRGQATLLFVQTTTLQDGISLTEISAKGPINPLKFRPQTDALR